jgi:serine/threonine-protein kinase
MQCSSCNAQIEGGKFCPVCGKPVEARPATGASAGGAGGAGGSGGGAEEQDTSLVGQQLGGKYKVVKLLGEGGMGAVYQGEQQLGPKTRNVAIKTLHNHLSKDPKILARFEREVGTVAELEHPNTIQVYDFGKTPEGLLYIVMEFIQGTNLAEQLEKNGAMEPARVEKIMTQICGSLEEAHGRGIVHRDLKPDNVVLTERAGQKDFVKVLDFGIAKRSNEEDKNEQKLTQQGMVLGTPPYMSPEQFTGKPIDARSDIYSLAIMAYEMLTGNLPFQANTAWEWATQHMTQPPKDIDTMPNHERIPPRMKDALRKALQKSPEDRFANVHQFMDAFVNGVGLPAGGGTQAAMPAAMPGAAKGRTEVGTPLDFGAVSPGGYGSNPGPMSPAPGQPSYGTPAQGNVAFPTPGAGVPQPASASRSGGGGVNKGMILGIAGVVGVLSIGAIVLALKGHSSSVPAQPLDVPSAAPSEAVLTPPDAGALAQDTPAPSGSVAPLAPLDPSGGGGGGGGGEHGGGSKGGKGGKGTPPPAPAPSHGAAPPPAPTLFPTAPPASTEPIECVKARLMRQAGNILLFQQLERQCIAKGGHI